MPDAEEVKSNEWSRNKQGTEGFFGKNSSQETLETLRISPPKMVFNFPYNSLQISTFSQDDLICVSNSFNFAIKS